MVDGLWIMTTMVIMLLELLPGVECNLYHNFPALDTTSVAVRQQQHQCLLQLTVATESKHISKSRLCGAMLLLLLHIWLSRLAGMDYGVWLLVVVVR